MGLHKLSLRSRSSRISAALGVMAIGTLFSAAGASASPSNLKLAPTSAWHYVTFKLPAISGPGAVKAAPTINETCGWSPTYVDQAGRSATTAGIVYGGIDANCTPEPLLMEFEGCIQHSQYPYGPWDDDADSCGSQLVGPTNNGASLFVHNCYLPGELWYYRSYGTTAVEFDGQYIELYPGPTGGPPSIYSC
jgi:hypothetical protein